MIDEIEGMDEIKERWTTPFNFIEDVFRVRNPYTGDLEKYKPYPYILEFIDDGFRDLNMDRLVLKSRQIGMSTAMELEAIMSALTFPSVEISVISNKYESSKKVIRACGRMIKDATVPLPVRQRDIQKESIAFMNGSTIIPYSSNPDSIRSENILRAYLDEFAFFPEQEALIAAVEPKTSRGGSITYISTPLSSNDEFMRLYNAASKGSIHGMKTYFFPLFEPGTVDETRSLFDQPHLVPICADIRLDRPEQSRAKSPDTFLQEYMCLPIDDTKAYYPHNLIMPCVDDDVISKMKGRAFNKRREGTVYMGIDLALVRDETAIVLVYSENNVNYVIHCEKTQEEYKNQLRIIDNLVYNYRPTRIIPDKTNPMGIQTERDLKDRYGYLVEGVTYTNAVKQEMAMRLKMCMQNTIHAQRPSIYFPNDEDLITQLHGIKIDVTAANNVVFSGKGGGGLDDVVNALWLAVPPETIVMAPTASVSKSEYAPHLKKVATKPVSKESDDLYVSMTRHSKHSKIRKHGNWGRQ